MEIAGRKARCEAVAAIVLVVGMAGAVGPTWAAVQVRVAHQAPVRLKARLWAAVIAAPKARYEAVAAIAHAAGAAGVAGPTWAAAQVRAVRLAPMSARIKRLRVVIAAHRPKHAVRAATALVAGAAGVAGPMWVAVMVKVASPVPGMWKPWHVAVDPKPEAVNAPAAVPMAAGALGAVPVTPPVAPWMCSLVSPIAGETSCLGIEYATPLEVGVRANVGSFPDRA